MCGLAAVLDRKEGGHRRLECHRNGLKPEGEEDNVVTQRQLWYKEWELMEGSSEPASQDRSTNMMVWRRWRALNGDPTFKAPHGDLVGLVTYLVRWFSQQDASVILLLKRRHPSR